jgi:general secretion pathway protein L
MNVLVIQIPARTRLAARSALGDVNAGAGVRVAGEFPFVLSTDGSTQASNGSAAPSLLPRADRVVAVLADTDVSWHRIDVPKAPAARLRAALAGAMEEALLDDDAALHFALGPMALPGQNGWVAVMNRPWLVATLAELGRHGVRIDQLVPASAPDEAVSGHFHIDDADADAGAGAGDDVVPTLVLAGPEGVVSMCLQGQLARALVPPPDAPAARWTATPTAAAAAERWLGGPVIVLGGAERTLQAARSALELRQFDLAPRHRGMQSLREAARGLLKPEWRPVRWGLAALVGLQVVGLNAWAWQQQRAIEQRRQAMVELLKSSHPQVRAVLDAPVQMQRETEQLRARAGRAGDGDLEALLAAAAAAWPDGQPPVQTLRFESGRLTLAASDWDDGLLQAFRERLQPAGYAAELADGRVTLSRVATNPRGRA